MKMLLASVLVSLVGLSVLWFSLTQSTSEREVQVLSQELERLESDSQLVKSFKGIDSTTNVMVNACAECSQLSDKVKRLKKRLSNLERDLVAEREKSDTCWNFAMAGSHFSGESWMTIAGLVMTFLGMLPAWFSLAARR